MNSKLKNILLIVVISLVISSLTVFITLKFIAKPNEVKNGEINIADQAALFDSADVEYDNSNGLNSNRVQGAIDELYQHATDYSGVITRLTALENNQVSINDVYPVGSIYISVNNTNPGTIFGGTWVSFGTGKTLVGVDSNDTDFDTVEESGGNKSATLQTVNLPAHSHTYTPDGTVSQPTFTGTEGNTGNTGGGQSHSHSVSNTSSSRTTSQHDGHSHSINNHNVSLSSSDGSSTHVGFTATNRQQWVIYTASTQSGGAHSHTVTDYYANTTSGGTTLTVNQMPNHGHTYTPSGTVSQPTFTGTQGTTDDTGSGTAFSTQNPYITVYMWKRTG